MTQSLELSEKEFTTSVKSDLDMFSNIQHHTSIIVSPILEKIDTRINVFLYPFKITKRH